LLLISHLLLLSGLGVLEDYIACLSASM